MEEVTCKVCSTKLDLSKTNYCPKCGFEIHVYPTPFNSDLQAYEDKRVGMYKATLLKQKEIEEERAQEKAIMEQRIKDLAEKVSVSGYLVLGQYKEAEIAENENGYKILDVFRVLNGNNIYGRRPKKREDAHVESILFPCKELQNEHFMVISSENDVTAKLLAGDWNVRNRTNSVTSEVLQDRDEIYIGNLIFTFILSSEQA